MKIKFTVKSIQNSGNNSFNHLLEPAKLNENEVSPVTHNGASITLNLAKEYCLDMTKTYEIEIKPVVE